MIATSRKNENFFLYCESQIYMSPFQRILKKTNLQKTLYDLRF